MKIEKIKKYGDKYKITLNNGNVINTFDNVILENNLLFKKHIDCDLLEKINNDTIYYDSYNKALKMINRRLRSEFEMNEYLKKLSISLEYKEKIINNLKKIGLIDDYNFASAYTNDKINLSLDGPYKIARDLSKNKIDANIIDEMINSYPLDIMDAHIEKIILQKLKTNKKYTGYILKQKIIQYLLNMGYSNDNIKKHLYLVDKNNINMEKEMERIYKKYSLKYQGDKLYFKLKQKLFSKGFSSEEINNFISKLKDSFN